MRSVSKLTKWKEINNTIKDKEKVANYLAWLIEEYPEVFKYEKLEALDNEDKRELEERSQSEANQFWEWLEDNFPSIWDKLTKHEVENHVSLYCDEHELEYRELMKYFWHNSKYPKKKIRIWKKTYYWVEFDRTIEH